MITKNYQLKTLILALFIGASQFKANAQETLEDDLFLLDSLIDMIIFEEEGFIDDILESANKYNLIYTNVTYDENTFFLGRDNGIDQFTITSQIAYYSSKGLNASISGVYFSDFEPRWAFTNLSVGYLNYIGDRELFNYGVGYTRIFYSDGWSELNNALDFAFGFRNKGRWLTSKIAGSYLFGSDQSFQVVSRSACKINLLKKEKFFLRFKPQLSFFFSRINTFTAREEIESDFSFVNTQFNFPFSLITKSWDVSVGYNVNLPVPVQEEPGLRSTGFFRVSVGYLIDFKAS